MAKYNIQVAKGSQKCYLGEGPHWNADKQEILYVDIFGKAIHRFVPSTGESAKVTIGAVRFSFFIFLTLDYSSYVEILFFQHEWIDAGPVSVVAPVEGYSDKYLVTIERDVQIMEWDGKSATPSSLKKLYTVDDHCKTNRINDGKCDAKGRLWAGMS